MDVEVVQVGPGELGDEEEVGVWALRFEMLGHQAGSRQEAL